MTRAPHMPRAVLGTERATPTWQSDLSGVIIGFMSESSREALRPEVLAALENVRKGRRRLFFVIAAMPVLALLSLVPYVRVVTIPAFVIGWFAVLLLGVAAHSTPCPCCNETLSYQGGWLMPFSLDDACLHCGVKIDQRTH